MPPASRHRRDLRLVAAWLVGWWLLAGIRTPRPAPPPAGPRRRGWAQNDADCPPTHGPPPPPDVSVVVPARDEQNALPALLASLAGQTCPPGEVIVVDDDSADATAAVATAAGATVVMSAGPPDGWSGKCFALHRGQARATGRLLVFLDADVTLAPDGLERVVAEHARLGGTGLVSVEPYHRTARPYEQLSAVCNVVALMGTGAFTGPPRRVPAVAFGPCLVVDRATYEMVGGHAHPDVRSKITEDLALARRTRACGRPVAVFAGGPTVAFRMYPGGVRQLVDGWTKVLATGAAASPAITVAVAVWVTGGLVVTGRLGRLILTGHRPGATGAAYGGWVLQLAWMLGRVGRFGPVTAAAFPLPLAAFVGFAVRSASKIGRGRPLAWRGRSLSGR